MERGVEREKFGLVMGRNWGGVGKKKKEEKRGENTLIKVTTEEI